LRAATPRLETQTYTEDLEAASNVWPASQAACSRIEARADAV